MIRKAAERDFPAIAEILQADSLPTDDLIVPGVESEFFVEDDGSLAGVAGVEYYDRTALVRSVAVNSGSRSGGIGRRLVERAIEAARLRGCVEAVLLTETAESWFARLGFVRIGKDALRPEVLRAGQVSGARCASAAVMRLELAPGAGVAASDETP